MILLVNGPNLNLLGEREPEVYGSHHAPRHREDGPGGLRRLRASRCGRSSRTTRGRSSTSSRSTASAPAGIIVNPGAFTHTSYALHDCLKSISVPAVEVHISNVHAREEWRRESLIAPACRGADRGARIRPATTTPPSGCAPRSARPLATTGVDDADADRSRCAGRRGPTTRRPSAATTKGSARAPRRRPPARARRGAHRAGGGGLHPAPELSATSRWCAWTTAPATGAGRSWTRLAGRDRRVRVVRGPGEGIARALERGLAACDAGGGGPHGRRRRGPPAAARAAARGARAPTRRSPRWAPASASSRGATLRGGMVRYAAWLNGLVTPELVERDLLVEAPLVHPAAAIRRAALEAVGAGATGDFPEDYDLWLRLAAAGRRLTNVPGGRCSTGARGRRALTRTDPRYALARHVALKCAWLAAARARPRERGGAVGRRRDRAGVRATRFAPHGHRGSRVPGGGPGQDRPHRARVRRSWRTRRRSRFRGTAAPRRRGRARRARAHPRRARGPGARGAARLPLRRVRCGWQRPDGLGSGLAPASNRSRGSHGACGWSYFSSRSFRQ